MQLSTWLRDAMPVAYAYRDECVAHVTGHLDPVTDVTTTAVSLPVHYTAY